MPSLSGTLKRLFGAGNDEVERSIVMDGSDDAKRIIGGKLYEGVMAEVSAAAGAKKLAEFVKSSKEHCDEHRRTERRLEGELDVAREANRTESGKVMRLGNLISEIGTALDSGHTLTSADIRVGKRNALNPNYFQMTYLPGQKPVAKETTGKVDGKAASGVSEQPQA